MMKEIIQFNQAHSDTPTRTWRELKEINFSNQLNVLKKYTIKENPAKLKFGLSATIRNRDFEVDSYFFKANPNNVVDGNANNILAAQNIWTVDSGQGTFLDSNNIYQPSNSYEGAQTIFAAYLANEFDLFKSFKTSSTEYLIYGKCYQKIKISKAYSLPIFYFLSFF